MRGKKKDNKKKNKTEEEGRIIQLEDKKKR